MEEQVIVMPTVALRGMTILPGMVQHFDVSRPKSIAAVEKAMLGDQKLFELDDVKLEFTPEALEEVANLAVKRKIGARGLRSILENAMMDLMYEIPSDDTVGICTITKDVIDKTGEPELVYRDAAPTTARKSVADRLRGGKKGEIA